MQANGFALALCQMFVGACSNHGYLILEFLDREVACILVAGCSIANEGFAEFVPGIGTFDHAQGFIDGLGAAFVNPVVEGVGIGEEPTDGIQCGFDDGENKTLL